VSGHRPQPTATDQIRWRILFALRHAGPQTTDELTGRVIGPRADELMPVLEELRARGVIDCGEGGKWAVVRADER